MRIPQTVTVDAAFALFTRPRRHRRTSAELALLAEAERSVIRGGGDDLAVYGWGAGPTVLLLHGWEGRGTQFHAFVPRLRQKGFRAVAIDFPGHGDSTGTTSSIPHFAATVSLLARALGEIVAVIGHSGGGAGAIYAFTRGLDVAASVHMASPCSFERGIERFSAAAGLSQPDRAEFRRRIEEFIPVPLADTDLARLALPDHPALVLHDPADKDVPFSEAELIVAAWRSAELHPLPGVGHRRILQSGEAVDLALRLIGENAKRGAAARR
jgi:pimeloyl-ACP methyl ester carboxylesterase